MASPGMAEIHGPVGRPHAEPTQGLNTRAISTTSTRITSLLVVDCAWEFAKSADDPRTIPFEPRRGRKRRRNLAGRCGSQARNRCCIAALFAYLLAARGGEIYVP